MLEALLALLVLGGAIAISLQALSSGLRAQARARGHLHAVALAEDRLRSLTALPVDSLKRYTEAQAGGFDPPFEEYHWQALVSVDSLSFGLVQAAVRVEWPRGEYTLETTLYRSSGNPAWMEAMP